MKKSEIVAAIAERGNTSKVNARAWLDHVLNAIADGLVGDGKVTITDFATIAIKTRAARVGTNPQNGERMQISAKNSIKIRPLKALKARIDKYKP